MKPDAVSYCKNTGIPKSEDMCKKVAVMADDDVLTSSKPNTCIHVIFVREKCLFLWEFFTDMGLEWSQD